MSQIRSIHHFAPIVAQSRTSSSDIVPPSRAVQTRRRSALSLGALSLIAAITPRSPSHALGLESIDLPQLVEQPESLKAWQAKNQGKNSSRFAAQLLYSNSALLYHC